MRFNVWWVGCGLVLGLVIGGGVVSQWPHLTNSPNLTVNRVATKQFDLLLDGYLLSGQIPVNWNVGQFTNFIVYPDKYRLDQNQPPLFGIARENVSQQEENELKFYADTNDIAQSEIDRLRKKYPDNNFMETSATVNGLLIRKVITSGGPTEGRSWYITVPTDQVIVNNSHENDPNEQKSLTVSPKTILITQSVNYGDDKEFDQQIDKIIQSFYLSSVNGGQALKFQ